MSLVLNRLLQQQCLQASKFYLLSSRTAGNFTMTKTQSPTLNKDFWSKNQTLNRPMSPHLSVYKMQMTSLLSISHRLTGVGASVVLYTGGIGALFCMGTSFPELILMIQQLPQPLIVATKMAIGGAIVFHTLNGIRHLVWDVGYGFQLKHLYLSGYVVVALTAIGTALIFIKG